MRITLDLKMPSSSYRKMESRACTTAEGVQWAELDSDWDGPIAYIRGEPASIKICQSLTTIPGGEYQLRFCFSPRPDTDTSENVLVVRWDGEDVDTISLAGGETCEWIEYTYDLIATECLTELEFADGGISNSLGTYIDDVRVIGLTSPRPVIPEPPIIVCKLLMFSVLAIFLVARKRKANVDTIATTQL